MHTYHTYRYKIRHTNQIWLTMCVCVFFFHFYNVFYICIYDEEAIYTLKHTDTPDSFNTKHAHVRNDEILPLARAHK